MAYEFGIELWSLPNYVDELADRVATTEKEIDVLIRKKEYALAQYEMTTDVIREILRNGPYMLGVYQKMKVRLRKVEDERNQYKAQLESLIIKGQEIEMARKKLN
jgi:hypothetical protein